MCRQRLKLHGAHALTAIDAKDLVRVQWMEDGKKLACLSEFSVESEKKPKFGFKVL